MHELLIIVSFLLTAQPPAQKPPASVVGGTPLKLPAGDGGPTVLQGAPIDPAGTASAVPPVDAPPKVAAQSTSPAPISLSPESAAALVADARRRDALRDLTRRLFPEPITEAELDWWTVSLGLGPDAVAFARDLRSRYENKVRAALVPEAAAMVMASYDWSEDGTRLVPRWTPVHVSMVVRRSQLVAVLRDAEAQLSRDLLAIVPPERQREARRLFFRRQFEVGGPNTAGTLAGLDVVSLVEECRLPEAELLAVGPLLDTYVSELGPTMRARTFAALDRDVQEAQLLAALGPMWQAVVSEEDRRSIEEELAALRVASDDASAPLRRLNRTTLLALASQLPSRSAATVLDRVWLRVHPTQFEDERGLVRLVMEAIEHPSATESDRDGRLNFVATLRTKLLPLGLDVAEIADHAAGSPLAASAGDSDARAAALTRLDLEIARLESLIARRTICLDAAHGLESMLTATEAALLERCRAFRQALELRSSADTWMLRRCRTRVAEIHARDSEEALAAENAELETGEPAPIDGTSDGDGAVGAGGAARPGAQGQPQSAGQGSSQNADQNMPPVRRRNRVTSPNRPATGGPGAPPRPQPRSGVGTPRDSGIGQGNSM